MGQSGGHFPEHDALLDPLHLCEMLFQRACHVIYRTAHLCKFMPKSFYPVIEIAFLQPSCCVKELVHGSCKSADEKIGQAEDDQRPHDKDHIEDNLCVGYLYECRLGPLLQ